MYVYRCICIWSQRIILAVIFKNAVSPLREVSHWFVRSCIRLDCLWTPKNLLSAIPQCWAYGYMLPPLQFGWVLGLKLMSLCLQGQHFTKWAICPVLQDSFSVGGLGCRKSLGYGIRLVLVQVLELFWLCGCAWVMHVTVWSLRSLPCDRSWQHLPEAVWNSYCWAWCAEGFPNSQPLSLHSF